ncbi:hypothetical protein I3J27_16510 [Bradyrhizobium xenonodulans]|uniref:Transposase n=1 Tax=Bradyrhizobium xenonodulans TaxID=2736875 RepID=A0ABY7MWF1_9BRAD|nr:hypothetical protein [Bradyrhizobium xenonodulans]WBL81941.1 hypothetical protein I3J27_16510 [Bradyrhizobium xenonodulans]
MEAATGRKDVIKRFWNIDCEHSAIALHLVRAPETSCDAQPRSDGGTSSQSHNAAGARLRAIEGGAERSVKSAGEQILVTQGRYLGGPERGC